MTHPIPSAYRIFFATIDPLVASTGVIGNLFVQHGILDSYNPNAKYPPSIETKVCLQSLAGFLAGTMFLQIVLLRIRPRDIAVWKCLEASIAIVDCAIIAAVLKALDDQGRLSPELWRLPDWTNLGVTGFVLLYRVSFLLGIGMPKAAKGKRP